MLQVNQEGVIRTVRKVHINDQGTLRQIEDIHTNDHGGLRYIFNWEMYAGTSANPTSFVSTYGDVDTSNLFIYFNQPVGLTYNTAGTQITLTPSADQMSVECDFGGVDGEDDTLSITVNDYYTLNLTLGIPLEEEEGEGGE